MLSSGHAVIFLEFVGAIERGKINGCRQARADPEPVDRSATFTEVYEFGLVDAAASEDFDVCEAALIEDTPNAFGKLDEIAAVEPDRSN